MSKELNDKRREQIGVLLKHERKCQKLEQVVIARKMDSRQEDISKIESGSRRIDILELINYAEALGFSITEIAWKIETCLSASRLLPLPKNNIIKGKVLVEVLWDENKFSASIGMIIPKTIVFTANTFDELKIIINDRINFHIKEMVAHGFKVPSWLVRNEYEFEYKFLDATSLLKAYSSYISFSVISRISGINQNLLSQYANGMKKAGQNQIKRIVEAIHIISEDMKNTIV